MRADVFVKYALRRFWKEREMLSFMTYVTDSLYLSGRSKTQSRRWFDIARPARHEDVDPHAVLDDLVDRAGLVVV